MLLFFKRLNSKSLSLISSMRQFHPNVKLEYKKNADCKIETLVNGEQVVQGSLAILQYFGQNLKLSEIDLAMWTQKNLVDITLMKQSNTEVLKELKIIKTKTFEVLDKQLEKQKFFSGDKFGIIDIIIYIRIRKYISIEKHAKIVAKLVNWFKLNQESMEKNISEILKEFNQEEKQPEKKDDKKSKQEQKEKKKDEKKQSNLEKQPEKKQPVQAQAPAKQSKKKAENNIPEEYMKLFSNQKLVRIDKNQKKIPKKELKNILITSALPYVNNVPHLGNLIGCVLSGDVFSRYCRLRGHNSIYISGTDEYGTATEMKAIQEKLTPRQICDKYHVLHKNIYEWFDIDFDYFGRTTTDQQTQIAQDIFKQLERQNFLLEDKIEQCFCTTCDTALADRFVGGICPLCNYADAKGDQCDSCGKLLNPIELKEPKCMVCKSTPVVRSSNHIFIDLTNIQPILEKWVEKTSSKWSANSLQVTQAWLKQGLKQRCITRDLKWGTPVPRKGFENKVFYVWFDAPIGYISITANYTNEWEKWWKNPDQVSLYQFMGKDNIPFHTVIFPSSLLGSKDSWTMLENISTTEYLNYEDGKFSKSRGVGVFGDNVQGTNIPSEIWRYYLLSIRPEKSDSIFTWTDFQSKNNNELLTNIGNLCNRVFKFIDSKYNKQIPKLNKASLQEIDKQFLKESLEITMRYIQALDDVKLREGLAIAMELSSHCNKYIQDNQPWDKNNFESKRSDLIINIICKQIRLLSALFESYMPSLSAKINFLLGIKSRSQNDELFIANIIKNKNYEYLLTLLPEEQVINQPVPLINEISSETIEELRNKYKGAQTAN